MTRKYILTGGPGSGKSSILLELETRGEYVLRESAEDLIRLEQAKGNPRPWEKDGFQDKILLLQIQREDRIPQGIERVFLDRSILDGLAYATPGSAIYKETQRNIRPYSGVFLIESIGNIQKTEVRKEDDIEALILQEKLKEVYLMAGYKIPIIGANTVEERTETILSLIDSGRFFR
jgi:predicted ATPase